MPLHPVPAQILSSAHDRTAALASRLRQSVAALPMRVQWAALSVGYLAVIGVYVFALLGMLESRTAPLAARMMVVLLALAAVVVLGLAFGRIWRRRHTGRHRAVEMPAGVERVVLLGKTQSGQPLELTVAVRA